MRHKKLLALPVLWLAMGSSAQALSLPTLDTNFAGLNTPSTADYRFSVRGLSVDVTGSGNSYTLSATGNSNFSFATPGNASVYTATGSYSLVANFDGNGVFNKTGSDLTISGIIPAAGVTTSSTLFSAQLTDFGFNTTQDTLGFTTEFNPSWSTSNSAFTGGSTGETVYLFDLKDLLSVGTGSLAPLIAEFKAGALSTGHYGSVYSVTAVPLPLPAVLFGSGLTALLGLGRRARTKAA